MRIKLRNLGSNQNVITMGAGDEVFFSYETPVAGFINNRFVVTSKKFSSTTSKHIKKYLGSCDNPDRHPQEYFDNLLDNLYKPDDIERMRSTIKEMDNKIKAREWARDNAQGRVKELENKLKHIDSELDYMLEDINKDALHAAKTKGYSAIDEAYNNGARVAIGTIKNNIRTLLRS